MNFDTIKNIVSHWLNTLVRHAFVLVGAWLIKKGIPWLSDDAQGQVTNVVVGAIMAGGALCWSFLRSRELGALRELAERFGLKKASGSVPPAALALLVGLLGASVVGCATIVNFDQNSLDSAKKLKYQSLQLIAHGAEKPDAYQDQIKALQNDLATEIAYEKGKGAKNLVTEKQWETLASPDHLLGRFLKDWSGGKQFSQAFIDEDSKIIGDVFDSIVELEAAKSK